jgi:hypothetical protein
MRIFLAFSLFVLNFLALQQVSCAGQAIEIPFHT